VGPAGVVGCRGWSGLAWFGWLRSATHRGGVVGCGGLAAWGFWVVALACRGVGGWLRWVGGLGVLGGCACSAWGGRLVAETAAACGVYIEPRRDGGERGGFAGCVGLRDSHMLGGVPGMRDGVPLGGGSFHSVRRPPLSEVVLSVRRP